MYKLSSSQSDRINFNNVVYACLSQSNFALTPSRAIEYFPNLEDDVDDIDEAKERIVYVAKRFLLDRLADELDEIEQAVKVYDTGLDVFGTFKTGADAADSIRNANPDWWLMREVPSYEIAE